MSKQSERTVSYNSDDISMSRICWPCEFALKYVSVSAITDDCRPKHQQK